MASKGGQIPFNYSGIIQYWFNQGLFILDSTNDDYWFNTRKQKSGLD